MICPKCNAQMETVTYDGLEVQRCTSCQGLWFDVLEKERLAAMEGSEAIDTGDPKVGRFTHDIEATKCPRCDGKMIRMVDPAQHHIWFDSCYSCGGVFFDAGEFTDYKHHDWIGRLKDLFTPEQREEEEPPHPES
ncbi:MAG: hypothetical protein GC159_21845 [Phycisphaera sp.]|nr:hypothetical protein [Phycisphaera sp.]